MATECNLTQPMLFNTKPGHIFTGNSSNVELIHATKQIPNKYNKITSCLHLYFFRPKAFIRKLSGGERERKFSKAVAVEIPKKNLSKTQSY